MTTGGTKLAFWKRHEPVLLGAALALVGALGGSAIGANAALQVAESQNEAEDVRRSQDKRDVVYRDYLNAANDYFYSWQAWASTAEPVEGEEVARMATRFRDAGFEFQRQANEVYVHGSAEAVELAEDMKTVLPESIGGSELPPKDAVPNVEAFTIRYNAFLELRCAEAAPVARSSCSQR